MKPIVNYKRFLPHKQEENSIVSVTWRQNLTIPQALLDLLQEQSNIWHKTHALDDDKRFLHEQQYQLFDTELAKYNHPEFKLTDSEIAYIIKDALHFYNDKKYRLHAYCIMSNHIHALIQPISNSEGIIPRLQDIVRGLKTFTAKKINELRRESGSVWAKNFYDSIIRDEDHYWNVLNYILNNPVKAGIVEKWQDYKYLYWNSLLLERDNSLNNIDA
ncbi:MAG: transposase [Candidatus Cloacimonetes bacterium]|jgi:REP element-mobilizing transposase RayT|nr:transposase [Candidatus Cloacimonadota bacterium]